MESRRLPIPPELAAPVRRDRVLAVVRKESEAAVSAALLGVAPLQVMTCSYCAVVVIVSSPPGALLLDAAAVGDVGAMLGPLLDVPGLVDDTPTIVVGDGGQLAAPKLLRFSTLQAGLRRLSADLRARRPASSAPAVRAPAAGSRRLAR